MLPPSDCQAGGGGARLSGVTGSGRGPSPPHSSVAPHSPHPPSPCIQTAKREVVERAYQELQAAGAYADEARFEVARRMTEVWMCGV